MTDLSSLPELASLPQPLIRLDAVSKSFATRAGRFDAVRDVSLSIRAGDTFGIIGKSGAGKSTLLRLINLLERPDAGTVRVGGTELTALGKPALRAARQNIGMIFQQFNLLQNETVFENVAFPLRVHTQLPDEMIRDIVLLKLQAVGLRGAVDLMPDELSGGMKRRVALARAIALDPQILMYDEPFVGQDPIAMGVLVRLIRLLNDALGITSILVSHDLAETASIADYLYVVGDGQVLGQGTPEELMDSDNPRIRQFMKGDPDGPVPFHFPATDYRADLLGKR